jgi:hypothetical protein
MTLQAAIADYLDVMAEATLRVGEDVCPEDHPVIHPELRARVKRAQAKVLGSFDATPEMHAAHLRSFTKGMRIVLSRLPNADYRPPRAVGVCGWCMGIVHQGAYAQQNGKVYHELCAAHASKWQWSIDR